MRTEIRPLLLLFLIGIAHAQSFEVASVKENKSGEARQTNNFRQPGPRFTATNIPLDLLIAFAYEPLLRVQTVDWPVWLSNVRYDINAIAEGNPSTAEKERMLQSLLADRFQLKAHRETQQRPVFALTVVSPGKLGPQMHPHPDDAGCTGRCDGFTGSTATGHISGEKITIARLINAITVPSGRYVIDQTGIAGAFDFTLEFAPILPPPPGGQAGPDPGASDSAGLPTLFTALQQQLGLKLVPQTGPVPVLVVDHIERPSEN